MVVAGEASDPCRARVDDLRPHLRDEIEAFSRHDVALQGRGIAIGEPRGPKRARESLEAGMARAGQRG